MKAGLLAGALFALCGCTMQSAFKINCDGKCAVEVERGIDAKAPGSTP